MIRVVCLLVVTPLLVSLSRAQEFYRGHLPPRDFYVGNFFIGSPHAELGVDQAQLDAARFTMAVEAWVPQGDAIRLEPRASGELYLSKLLEARMSLETVIAGADRRLTIKSGESVQVETAGLESGTYYLSLVRNGVVAAALRVHLAFRDIPISPDYEVTVVRSGKAKQLPSFYTYRRDGYMRYNSKLEGELIEHEGPVVAHSWAELSASDYPVTVRLKVLPGAQEISLPLTSARVLPSSNRIDCSVEGGDTIVFTLDRPEKVIVIPNHAKAVAPYERRAEGHEPLQDWASDLEVEMSRASYHASNPVAMLSEGYRNPFVFLGRGAEVDVPDPEAAGTLVVFPGDQPTQAEIDQASTVWFKPGAHDFSRLGDWMLFHTKIHSGQTFYLEEGAWLQARIVKASTSVRHEARLIGRGTVLGANHFWGGGGFPAGSQIIEVDEISGINFVERAYFGIEGGRLIEDIAMLGSWHWNNDGVDSMDNCTIRNSLLMAHDDNLKLNHNTHAENLVLMMLGTNGHAIMVKEILTGRVFSDSVVKDIDIIGYWKNPSPSNDGWNALTPGAIASVTGSDLKVRNFTFSDIRIESPFLYRVFSFYNMDTKQPYAPSWFWHPTDETTHTRLKGFTFENISVDSPLIAARSIIGSPYADSIESIKFIDLEINGVVVDEGNKEKYFQIDEDDAAEVRFEIAK